MKHNIRGVQEDTLFSPISTNAACTPGSTPLTRPYVDITDNAALRFPLDMDLLQDAAVDIGNPCFRGVILTSNSAIIDYSCSRQSVEFDSSKVSTSSRSTTVG
ncbi:MAG: hypothetical protein GPOALKHO_001835 [Sodalis sp.]|nr:MAG: hypothetical protein GPOALKHO_001835 [Sodalis sp.]